MSSWSLLLEVSRTVKPGWLFLLAHSFAGPRYYHRRTGLNRGDGLPGDIQGHQKPPPFYSSFAAALRKEVGIEFPEGHCFPSRTKGETGQLHLRDCKKGQPS